LGKASPPQENPSCGDDRGAAIITFGDEVMKVFILGGPNRFKAEVVDDQEIGLDQGLEATLKGVVAWAAWS
jgi:hypothetical protein